MDEDATWVTNVSIYWCQGYSVMQMRIFARLPRCRNFTRLWTCFSDHTHSHLYVTFFTLKHDAKYLHKFHCMPLLILFAKDFTFMLMVFHSFGFDHSCEDALCATDILLYIKFLVSCKNFSFWIFISFGRFYTYVIFE